MSVASTQPRPSPAPQQAGAGRDERLAGVSVLVRLLQRPELGALIGALAVYLLFASVDATPGRLFTSIAGMQNWTDAASTYGIMAVAVALLMIGGEFDLSAGVMTGTSGLLLGMLITRQQVNVWVAIVAVLVFAGIIGAANGMLVVRTKLPSFIITLATFFVLRGVDVGIMVALRFKGIQSGQGVGLEFFYIIAAVVGGCLLTGGYGSAIGASLGALIIGFAQIGIIFANWDSNWYYTFLGVILFVAVGVNTLVRRRAASARR